MAIAQLLTSAGSTRVQMTRISPLMTATTETTSANRNSFHRPDTFFGVCEAIGQDFGFNPLWLRLAFVPPVFFQPAYALVAYVTLGLVVLASRMMFPDPQNPAVTAETESAAVTTIEPEAPAAKQPEALPLAA